MTGLTVKRASDTQSDADAVLYEPYTFPPNDEAEGKTGQVIRSGASTVDSDTRTTASHEDIEDLVRKNEKLSRPESRGILDWLTSGYRTSRGFELGTFDSSLLALAMKEQSKKWNCIARARLISMLMDELVERYRKAFAQVEFVLQVRMIQILTASHDTRITIKFPVPLITLFE
ncbi:MAG: hypothetical protein M1830_000509 [Pleopsidium flavum]|nr:MAG: hypothetical protein M1830_000509 [Pleopsidium flavum]